MRTALARVLLCRSARCLASAATRWPLRPSRRGACLARRVATAVGLSAVLLLAACSTVTQLPPEPVRTAQILEMSRAGVPAADIIGEIERSRTVYYMNSDDVVRLREEGVEARVIDHMMGTAERAERRARARTVRTYYYADPYLGGPFFGGPFFWGHRYCW